MRATWLFAAGALFSALILALSGQARAPGGSAPRSLPTGELTAFDGVAGNALGIAVAVSGDTVVVGEDCGKIGGDVTCDEQHQGVVYVYEKPGNGWTRMFQTAELTPSDAFVGNEFGAQVAISGDTIVVGANNGKVYVFVKPAGGWKDMTETAQLTDGQGNSEFFGNALAIDQGTIVVGAPSAIVNGVSSGAAYVFLAPTTGWVTTSTFNARLSSSDGAASDSFGYAVGVSGGTIVVGAPFHQGRQGEAYIFTKPAAGWTSGTETAKLTRSNPGQFDEFGLAVGVYRNTAVVGAPQAAVTNGDGAADVFVKPASGWADATETAELIAPVFTQNIGFAVAIAGQAVTVGCFSPGNLVFVYDRPVSGWVSTSQPQFQLSGGPGLTWFGFSVAMDTGAIVVGAPFQTVRLQLDQGAAWVFAH